MAIKYFGSLYFAEIQDKLSGSLDRTVHIQRLLTCKKGSSEHITQILKGWNWKSHADIDSKVSLNDIFSRIHKFPKKNIIAKTLGDLILKMGNSDEMLFRYASQMALEFDLLNDPVATQIESREEQVLPMVNFETQISEYHDYVGFNGKTYRELYQSLLPDFL